MSQTKHPAMEKVCVRPLSDQKRTAETATLSQNGAAWGREQTFKQAHCALNDCVYMEIKREIVNFDLVVMSGWLLVGLLRLSLLSGSVGYNSRSLSVNTARTGLSGPCDTCAQTEMNKNILYKWDPVKLDAAANTNINGFYFCVFLKSGQSHLWNPLHPDIRNIDCLAIF